MLTDKNINNLTNKNKLNKLVLHPSFKKTVDEIKKVNITITESAKNLQFDFSNSIFPQNGKLKKIEKLLTFDLDPYNGQEFSKKVEFTGYDESKLNYIALEGEASFTAHSLVIASKDDYIPVNFLSFYFYTRSQNIKKFHPALSYSIDPTSESNRDYVLDRTNFLKEWSIKKSISFIDGPLIGGNMTAYTIKLVEYLHSLKIIPVFIVKNSDSNLVTDNLSVFKNKFHSDMHWSYNLLKPGQRSSFFLYTDPENSKNAKVFCYLKAFNVSPQRIEMHLETYKLYKNVINCILDLVYFLFLVQGDKKNPQIRPIAIAEKFARDILMYTDTYNIFKSTGLTPTMNQLRFGG